jgi:hypothetical protein
MAKLGKDNKKIVDQFLGQNGIIKMLNRHLKQKGLAGFEVESVRIKLREELVCDKPGQEKIEVCTVNGVCKQICWPP